MVAVGGEADGGEVVVEQLAGEQLGPVREDEVVGGEAFLGGRGGRNHERLAVAELEEEDVAVFVGEFVQSSVEG